jgi:hypothetical protein
MGCSLRRSPSLSPRAEGLRLLSLPLPDEIWRVILMFLVEEKFGMRGRSSALGAPYVPQVQ